MDRDALRARDEPLVMSDPDPFQSSHFHKLVRSKLFFLTFQELKFQSSFLFVFLALQPIVFVFLALQPIVFAFPQPGSGL